MPFCWICLTQSITLCCSGESSGSPCASRLNCSSTPNAVSTSVPSKYALSISVFTSPSKSTCNRCFACAIDCRSLITSYWNSFGFKSSLSVRENIGLFSIVFERTRETLCSCG